MSNDYDNWNTEIRTKAARQVGRQTFFEIADQQDIQAATDLMLRVVRMSELLVEQDVADWRKAYEQGDA